MHFDDRLETVLSNRDRGDASARTQYRQLIDLLGTLPDALNSPQIDAAYDRLGKLNNAVSSKQRRQILLQSRDRLRAARLVFHLSHGEGEVASAVIKRATLDEDDWLHLIPQLPIAARGFLRHRDDNGHRVTELLDRLGVQDRVLVHSPSGPEADASSEQHYKNITGGKAQPTEDPVLTLAVEDVFDATEAKSQSQRQSADDIGSLVKRIEAFRQSREGRDQAPVSEHGQPLRLPLGDRDPDNAQFLQNAFDFETNNRGYVVWADPAIAPMIVGILLFDQRENAPAKPDKRTLANSANRQPIGEGRIALLGAKSIEGSWRIDAVPHFRDTDGSFAGFRGRMRRPSQADQPSNSGSETGSDRIRQMLHELRTPVNAIQGFAEVIQQQLFGPTPNEYRAIAATIAGDAARMMAGFEEMDLLARWESSTRPIEEDASDLKPLVQTAIERVAPALSAKNATLSLKGVGGEILVPLAADSLEHMIWRVLAVVSSSLGVSEQVECQISNINSNTMVQLDWYLPVVLANDDNIFQPRVRKKDQMPAASAFGQGFALRLVRAQAKAIGGSFARIDDQLRLQLPLLHDNIHPKKHA